MNSRPNQLERLAFLNRVVAKETRHLQATDQRLFAEAVTPARVADFETDVELAERADAFVSRFGRLQDTLGDKLLPALLDASGETVASALDNLDRAERLGWVASVDDWLAMRRLRNQMVHEYIEDIQILCDALNTGHAFVPTLLTTAGHMEGACERLRRRGLSGN